MNQSWIKLASDESIGKSVESLKKNGIQSEVVKSGEEAKQRVLELIPEGAEVMTMTSVTADSIGLTEKINESGRYKSVRKLFESVDEKEKRHLGAAPDFAVGSVHAVTEDGHIFVASNTGSQLAAYVYGAQKVIWVVSTKKIVKDDEEARDRIFNYVLELESDRARKAYGVDGSNVSKFLEISKEINPNRAHLVFVKEDLGF